MKKIVFLATSLLFVFFVNAQVSKTVNITAGGLSAALTIAEFTSVTNLTITGSIDARDFKCMRDGITKLAVLDISAAKIETYSGNGGTSSNTFYPSNEIPTEAFYNCIRLTNVTIGDFVGSIGNYSFARCSSLTSITIPNSVTSIGNSAFSGCSKLSSLIIPNSVTSIGKNAFYACYSLTSITIPNSVTSIGERVFEGCNGLKSATIGNPNDSVGNISIGEWAFYSCHSLEKVTIGNAVTSIGNKAFNNCIRLTNVTIGDFVGSIGNSSFACCSSLTSITIPNSVTSIGNSAFNCCTSLTSVTIPNSVASIDDYAFANCTGLCSLYVNVITPCFLGTGVFTSVNVYVCSLYVPSGTKTAYQSTSGWSDFINIIEMPITSLTNQIMKVVNIYPSPVTDGFYVNGIEGTGTVTFTDLSGKVLFTKQVKTNEYITVNFLPKGVYIARVNTPKGIIVKIIIKD